MSLSLSFTTLLLRCTRWAIPRHGFIHCSQPPASAWLVRASRQKLHRAHGHTPPPGPKRCPSNPATCPRLLALSLSGGPFPPFSTILKLLPLPQLVIFNKKMKAMGRIGPSSLDCLYLPTRAQTHSLSSAEDALTMPLICRLCLGNICQIRSD